MLGMRRSEPTGTKYIKAEDYFQKICSLELSIEQINDEISQLEENRAALEEELSNTVVVYSHLITK